MDTLSLDQGLGELAKLQRSRATFWLTASTHVREGKKLSGFLSAYWPTMYATPVAIAEHSGRLSRVLEGLASTAEMQLEIQALMRKLLYPVGMILLGIAVNIFMLLAVIPALNMGGGRRPSGAMQLSMKVHDFVVDHPLILVVMATGIAFGLYRLVIRPDVSSSLIAKVDDLPVLSGTIRSLYFGLWCRYISLMQECSIPLQDASCPDKLKFVRPPGCTARSLRARRSAPLLGETQGSAPRPRCAKPDRNLRREAQWVSTKRRSRQTSAWTSA